VRLKNKNMGENICTFSNIDVNLSRKERGYENKVHNTLDESSTILFHFNYTTNWHVNTNILQKRKFQ